ncbi:Aste57867_8999 [Aphanomyces stellatus]|uniref:Aste57867_8999 protein n=1 Tax=Aphanomyces stellatus TaxID=120398 RepID=A0A485KLX7_9STRA|nr:hypothetical protein As57867_008964 [Aphanomyces stellatus]VFT85883.1 Aste57867_8999 [Aphanomyces stellatus]
MSAEAENIRVAVRCRPMSEKEIREQAQSCFVCKNGNAVLTNPENKDEVHEFGFDFVYGIDTEQRLVYEDFGRPVLERAFGGYNGTIFAYGQTGSGKTFSMTGIHGHDALEGLIPRMNKALFEKVQAEKEMDPNKLFLVECSFFEIYNEIIYDLLDSRSVVRVSVVVVNLSNSPRGNKNKGLEIKEHSVLGIYVKDLQERVVESREEVLELMTLGASNRTVGYTNMNAESSRSHSIFVVKIHQKDSSDETKNVFAKVNLVDLAGSERAAGTGAVGSRLKEGANINKSLSALGNVINALVEDARTGKKSFIPYRNSKLTRVLQESLGGNSLCSMLATLSPANINFIETLGTLKYASRAKSIKVNAKKNEEASQISQLNEEIAALKKKLTEQSDSGLDPREKNEIVAKYEKQIQEIDAVRMQTWEDKAKLSKQHEMERKKLAKEKARADQKTQEEKVKKWKLLESKADIELAIRATRELDVGDESWIGITTKAKSLEQDVKDARTLICVFKDSFDKDVASWKATQSEENEDASSSHTKASQLCTKIKNIQEESAKMMALENELLRQTGLIIDALCDEAEKLARAMPPPTTKEQKQLVEDREKALTITRTMIQTYRATLVSTLKTERKRILDFGEASAAMFAELQSQVDGSTMDDERKKARVMASKALHGALDACGKLVTSKPEPMQKVLIPKGELRALGVEGKIIADDRLTASSGDAKNARLNGANCWIAQADDATPWFKVDLGTTRFVDSVQIQGGVIGGSSILSDAPLVLTKIHMTDVSKRYEPTAVTGDHQQTYEIAKNVMSWLGLLKTAQVPTKLFSRPPVRFLHDVITLVVANTGYGQGVFTDKEKDYAQLAEKKDKSEYLVKVLQLVQGTYQGIVEVKATESNILAGKEPEQTMQCLALFCLGAVRHLAATLPEAAETPAEAAPVPVVETQHAWVTELSVESSIDGETWAKVEKCPIGGSADVYTAVATKFPAPVLARFVKFLITKWTISPAMRCEVFGFSVTEKDDTLTEVQDDVMQYLGLLTTLLSAGELILDEAKVKWKIAKDTQREKQAELKNVLVEIDTFKTQVVKLKADLDVSNKTLEKWKADKLDVDKQLGATSSKLESMAQSAKALEDQVKKAKGNIDTLTNQVTEATKEATTWKQQHAQVSEQLKSVVQSKADLEKLAESLRNQLSSKSAVEGATDSKMATLATDLQTVNIQLDESKRALQRSEKAIADAQAERDGLNAQLAKSRADMSAKEAAIEALETKHKSHLSEAQAQIAAAQASLEEAGKNERDVDAQLQKAVANSLALQLELEQVKKRGSESNQADLKRLQDEAAESEKRVFHMQANQVRLQADNERLEAKYASVEEKVKGLEAKLVENAQVVEGLQKEKKQLEELEEELQLQLQVVTDERDSARQKEEQLFTENAEKEQEIERIRDGYVWVTDRMNNKEDELAELQEQLEKYQSLLKLAGGGASTVEKELPFSKSVDNSLKPASSPQQGADQLAGLYKAVFEKDFASDNQAGDASGQLLEWIRKQKLTSSSPPKQQPAKEQPSMEKTPSQPDKSSKPKIDAQAETKAEAVKDTTSDLKTDVKPNAKSEMKAETRTETKAVTTEKPTGVDNKETGPEVKSSEKKGPEKDPEKKVADVEKKEMPKEAKPSIAIESPTPKAESKGEKPSIVPEKKAAAETPTSTPPVKPQSFEKPFPEVKAPVKKEEGTKPEAKQPNGPSLGVPPAQGNNPKEKPAPGRRESIEDLVPDAVADEPPKKLRPASPIEATEVAEEGDNEYEEDFDAYDDENAASKRGKSKRRIVDKQQQPSGPAPAAVEPVSAKVIAQNNHPAKG